MLLRRGCAVLVTLLLLRPMTALAQDEFKVVLEGLDNPSGVAIQPSTNHVFVSESGAGKVIRIEDGKPIDVVTGFPTEPYGPGPAYQIGPLGLGFIASDLLLVGGGGRKDGEDLLHVFEIKVGATEALDAAKTKSQFALPASDDEKGEGNFFALAITAGGVYVTANGDDSFGWIAKADRNGRNVGPFARHIPTKAHTGVDAPAAITVSPAGELLVGQLGEIKTAGDSQLTFYAEDGKKLANFATGLSDITAVAYSPLGNLYVADFAWAEPDKGGIYQVMVERKDRLQKIRTKRVAALTRPTSMVFSQDGSLYVTVYGEGENKKGGKLLKRAPGL